MKKQYKRVGKFKVRNWSEYNKSLKSRGDLTFWFTDEGTSSWLEEDSCYRDRGRQREYSDTAIKTIYILRQVFNLRLRQVEGFTKSILKILGVSLPTPDYTTISRRIREVAVDIRTHKLEGNINLILDSTGVKVVGEKEWIAYKYKTRQRKIWRKLHIGVTDDGSIVAGKVTTLRESDISKVDDLISQVENKVTNTVGDGAYYEKRMYESMKRFEVTRFAGFIGPPKKKNHNPNYGNRLRVEGTFSRYKRIIGNKFKAKDFKGQENEAKLSLYILNRMKDLGMPVTVRVA